MVGLTLLKRSYTSLIFFFLYAPIAVLIAFSFNASKSRGHWAGFTTAWYGALLHDQQILSSLYYTLMIAVAASLIATFLGTFAAIGIHNMRRFTRKLLMNLTYLPVVNADIVTGISLMLLFIFVHIKLGFISLLLAHITFNLPYVILSVLPKLTQLDRNVYEAALDLGASPLYAYFKVILPEIMPGIITGLLLSFTLSLDDFVISFFTTGSGVTNLSILIYSMARRGINPKINALSTIMFITVLALLILVNSRMTREARKNQNQKEKYENVTDYQPQKP